MGLVYIRIGNELHSISKNEALSMSCSYVKIVDQYRLDIYIPIYFCLAKVSLYNRINNSIAIIDHDKIGLAKYIDKYLSDNYYIPITARDMNFIFHLVDEIESIAYSGVSLSSTNE